MPPGIYPRTEYHSNKMKQTFQNPEYKKKIGKIRQESLACQRHRKRLHKKMKGKHMSPATEFKKGNPKPKNACKFPKGDKHWNWNNGETITRGYVLCLCPLHPRANKSGYILKAHLVIEKFIKRYLLPTEVTHHRGKKADNRPHMLMAFVNHSAHMRFHRGGKVKPSEIIFDGRKLISSSGI